MCNIRTHSQQTESEYVHREDMSAHGSKNNSRLENALNLKWTSQATHSSLHREWKPSWLEKIVNNLCLWLNLQLCRHRKDPQEAKL